MQKKKHCYKVFSEIHADQQCDLYNRYCVCEHDHKTDTFIHLLFLIYFILVVITCTVTWITLLDFFFIQSGHNDLYIATTLKLPCCECMKFCYKLSTT